jgi:energy-coupling factor transporter transmembrane protein EcfT
VIVAELDRVEREAALGRTPVHRASPAARVLAALLLVAAAVLAPDATRAAGVLAAAVALGALAGTGPHRVLLRALFPVPFLVSVYLLHPEAGFGALLLPGLRGVASAAALGVLLSSTPFADVLRVLARVMPRSLAAAFAVLYRSVFDLARASSHLSEAARLRGVRAEPGAMLGGMLLHAMERTENVACVLHVRGVDVPDPDVADAFRPRAEDLVALAPAAAALAFVLAGGGA